MAAGDGVSDIVPRDLIQTVTGGRRCIPGQIEKYSGGCRQVWPAHFTLVPGGIQRFAISHACGSALDHSWLESDQFGHPTAPFPGHKSLSLTRRNHIVLIDMSPDGYGESRMILERQRYMQYLLLGP